MFEKLVIIFEMRTLCVEHLKRVLNDPNCLY